MRCRASSRHPPTHHRGFRQPLQASNFRLFHFRQINFQMGQARDGEPGYLACRWVVIFFIIVFLSYLRSRRHEFCIKPFLDYHRCILSSGIRTADFLLPFGVGTANRMEGSRRNTADRLFWQMFGRHRTFHDCFGLYGGKGPMGVSLLLRPADHGRPLLGRRAPLRFYQESPAVH